MRIDIKALVGFIKLYMHAVMRASGLIVIFKFFFSSPNVVEPTRILGLNEA